MGLNADERVFYLDDFMCEVVPCKPTLEGWANWLSKADDQWEHEIPDDGEVFEGSALLFGEDIIAKRQGGTWTLSRVPDDDAFIAVRFGPALGWSPEQIIYPDKGQTMAGAIIEWLEAKDDAWFDEENIACAAHEDGWRFTYRAGAVPQLLAERVQ